MCVLFNCCTRLVNHPPLSFIYSLVSLFLSWRRRLLCTPPSNQPTNQPFNAPHLYSAPRERWRAMCCFTFSNSEQQKALQQHQSTRRRRSRVKLCWTQSHKNYINSRNGKCCGPTKEGVYIWEMN